MFLTERKLYELLNNSSSESKDEAKLVQLQSENQQLKEVIVKLYLKSEHDRQLLENEVKELSDRLHSVENGERSELSQLCAKYKTEVESLKVNRNKMSAEIQDQLSTTPTMSEDDVKLMETLKQESEKTKVRQRKENDSQELLKLDEDLINEYNAVIEGNQQQLDEKEHMLQNIALAFQSILQEKERLEQELTHQVQI